MIYLFRLLREQRGATAIEYALVATLISVAAITAFIGLGTSLTAMYGNVSSKLG